MNMRSTSLTSARTRTSSGRASARLLLRLPQYAILAGLGVTGGATGTALAIALAIAVQSRLSPTSTFSLGIIPFTLVAAVVGPAITWALAWSVYRIWPRNYFDFKGQAMQALLLISVFTSLVQAVVFTLGL